MCSLQMLWAPQCWTNLYSWLADGIKLEYLMEHGGGAATIIAEVATNHVVSALSSSIDGTPNFIT